MNEFLNDKKVLLYIAIIAIALIIIIWMLKPKTEAEKAEEATDATKEIEKQILQERKNVNLRNLENLRDWLTNSPALDPDYYKKAKPPYILLSANSAKNVAKILYDELNATFNTDETLIISTLANIKSLEALSQVASQYMSNNARNLRADLLEHSFLSGEATNLYNILKNIPATAKTK